MVIKKFYCIFVNIYANYCIVLLPKPVKAPRLHQNKRGLLFYSYNVVFFYLSKNKFGFSKKFLYICKNNRTIRD